MCDMNIDNVAATYEKNGYVSPVRLISEQNAIHHRGLLEEAETSFGNMHYRSKIHTIHVAGAVAGDAGKWWHAHDSRLASGWADGTCYNK